MIKKTLEEIISDYGIDGQVVNDLAEAIREYYKDVVWSEKFHKESAETLQSKLLELEATSGIRAVGSKTTILTKMNWLRRGEMRGTIENDEERLNSVCRECGQYINVGEKYILERNGGDIKYHKECFKKVEDRRCSCDSAKPDRLFGRIFTN